MKDRNIHSSGFEIGSYKMLPVGMGMGMDHEHRMEHPGQGLVQCWDSGRPTPEVHILEI